MNFTFNLELHHHVLKDGRQNVILRITSDRQHTRLKTGIAVKVSEFDPKAKYGQWIVKHPSRKNLNDELKDLIVKAEQQYKELEKQGPVASSSAVVYSLQNKPAGAVWTVGSFADKMVSEAATLSVGYERNLKSRLTGFVKFVGYDTPITAVSLEMLNRFKRFLKGQGIASSTQHTYFNRIKRMMLEAIRLDIVVKDPFQHFEMPSDRPAPRLKLTDQQVADLEAVDVTAPRVDTRGRRYNPVVWLFRAKQLYLFSFYMGGIRSSDMLQLRYGNLVGEVGAERLEYQMSKTGKQMSTRLNAKARQIIELLKTTRQPVEQPRPQDYLFGVLSNNAPYVHYVTHESKQRMPRQLAEQLFNDIATAQVLVNRRLKELAGKAGITDALTFHTARHSFADKARRRMKESKNISIDDIRQALGHDKLDTTQRYLNSFDKESLDSAMDAVFDD